MNHFTHRMVWEADEEEDSPWSEYEQGWRNIREDERAAVARQNAEDALVEAALGYVPSYMGVRGSAEYDEEGNFCGYIYEP